ncbi:MAG: hypothetical protein ACM3S3_03975 [Candidatus Doudnabacteria bacterium]|jgi:hypothetical protein
MAAKEATQDETARDVVMHIARIELASITAASKFFAGWAVSADRYVQAVNGEIRARLQGETESNELASHLAAASNEHLHELTALPNVAVRHFNRELAAANHKKSSR